MKTVHEIRRELQELDRQQEKVNEKVAYLQNSAYIRKVRREIAKKLLIIKT